MGATIRAAAVPCISARWAPEALGAGSFDDGTPAPAAAGRASTALLAEAAQRRRFSRIRTPMTIGEPVKSKSSQPSLDEAAVAVLEEAAGEDHEPRRDGCGPVAKRIRDCFPPRSG